MSNKVYTKTGDTGMTSLIGGKRVKKYDDRVEAYGSVDELSSFVGLLMDMEGVEEGYRKDLMEIQRKLFTIESHFALESGSEVSKMIPVLEEQDIVFLEQRIDVMEAQLPPLKSFVIPGGNKVASVAHICRSVCRRVERQAWRLASHESVNDLDLKYLNRLSDYFFVSARYFDFLIKRGESYWETGN